MVNMDDENILTEHRNKIIEIIKKNNQEELKEYISENKLLLNTLNNTEFDILIHAIENNASIDIIKYIIKQTKYNTLNYKTKNRFVTPLCSALAKNNFEISDYLIKMKADINFCIDYFPDLFIIDFLHKIDEPDSINSHRALNEKNLKYILNNGINANIINNKLIIDIINNPNGNLLLEIIFKHYIFNNDFIIKLLQIYHQKISLSDTELSNIILKEKNKILISDDMYENAFGSIKFGNYEAIKVLFKNDNEKRKIILCKINKYDILKKAIERKDYQFVKEVLSFKKLNCKSFNFEEYFIKANNNLDIIKLLINSSLSELPKLESNDSSTTIKKYNPLYFNFILNILIRLENLDSIKYLIENNKANIILNSKDINGEYPIFNVCYIGNNEIFKYLLDFDIDCNIKNNDISLLSLAISKNNDLFVEYLLNHGVNCNEKNINGDYPLINAIHQNAINIVILLIEHSVSKGIDMNVMDINGNTPLTLSYRLNYKTIFEYLLCYLDINKRDSKGNNILYYALKNEDIDTIKYLVRNKIDIDKRNNSNTSPLDIAISKGYIILLTLLENVRNNIPLNTPDIYGIIPLTKVIKSNKFRDTEKENLVEILILKGSNVNYIDKENNTPLIYAIQKERLSIIKILIINGANVNYYNSKANKYISNYAIDSKNTEIIKYLMHYNAKVTGDMIHDLICNKKLGILKVLFDNNVDINIKDSDGNSPLANAIICQNNEIASYLIECDGVDFKSTNNNGKDILFLNNYYRPQYIKYEINNYIKNY